MTPRERNASIKELQEEIRRLEKEIELLSIDSSYGVTTRPAVDLELRRISDRARFVIFLDIDHLHELNSTLPGKHEEANQKIRRALHVRSEDVLLRARWYSGDELIFVISGLPRLFIARLSEAFKREGMSFTAWHTPYTGRIEEDAARAKRVVDEMKAARGIGR